MACKFQIFCNFKNSLGHGNIVHCQKIYGTMLDFGCLIQNALRFEGITVREAAANCHPYEGTLVPEYKGSRLRRFRYDQRKLVGD